MQDVVLDFQAQATEKNTPTNPQPTPIPHIPQVPIFHSPIAPPPNPSTQTPLNITEPSRLILQPVPPSERAVPSVSPTIDTVEANIESNYLPQEFSEILKLQQRRERTWRARMIICTSIISNLESNIGSFQHDTEKEEAKGIQAYLRETIIKYAASEAILSPPSVPKHSRPEKCKGPSKHLKPSKPIQIAVPSVLPPLGRAHLPSKILPSQPTIILSNPPGNKNSWASVVRNGNKKACVNTVTNAVVEPTILPSKPVLQITNPKSAKNFRNSTSQDQRLFIRLPQEHEWRKLSPASIGLIKLVRSGFALSPCNTAARSTLLQEVRKLISTGAKLEPATNWVSFSIPNIPNAINTPQGQQEITGEMIIY